MTGFNSKKGFINCPDTYRVKIGEESRMSVVYIIQDFGQWNLTPAQEYGQVKVLLPARRQIIFSSAPVVSRLREGLRDVTVDDYLLLAGDPAAIGSASAIVAEKLGQLNLLKWDKQERTYYPVRINLRNYGEVDE